MDMDVFEPLEDFVRREVRKLIANISKLNV
jgi:hypothetical protein